MSVPARSAEVTVIGQRLADARRAQRLSVEDIATRTKLRPMIIEAIEADDFQLSGGDAYVVGHLRMIASAVGEDPEEIVEDYRRGSG
jgi:Uncharacterized protein conserved in bacteria